MYQIDKICILVYLNLPTGFTDKAVVGIVEDTVPKAKQNEM